MHSRRAVIFLGPARFGKVQLRVTPLREEHQVSLAPEGWKSRNEHPSIGPRRLLASYSQPKMVGDFGRPGRAQHRWNYLHRNAEAFSLGNEDVG